MSEVSRFTEVYQKKSYDLTLGEIIKIFSLRSLVINGIEAMLAYLYPSLNFKLNKYNDHDDLVIRVCTRAIIILKPGDNSRKHSSLLSLTIVS